MNDELNHPGLDFVVPDITKACSMFFSWSASQPGGLRQGQGEHIPTTLGIRSAILVDASVKLK